MTREYLSCADTAKLLRQALRESWPTVRFSIRSKTYSGGASINVHWTDGPATEDVKRICNAFEGAGFDGMTDYKSSRSHRFHGKPVSFGADFIFENRDVSPATMDAARAAWLALDAGEHCDMWNKHGIRWDKEPADIEEHMLRRFASLAATRLCPPMPSPTVGAIEFVSEH